MNFKQYFDQLPEDFDLVGAVDSLKLLKLYAFNAYFNADSLRTLDVENGCSFSREQNYGIDGVFLNESLDEDTIECLYSYYVGNNPFSLIEVFNAIDYIAANISSAMKNNYGANPKAEALLTDLVSSFEDEKPKVIIRIITDYECKDEDEKYDYTKKVSQHYVSCKGLDVSVAISFGDDVVNMVGQNKAPYEWVADGKLIVDNPNNILKYEDNSFVCNISALSLKKLWKAEGERGLLAMNLRYYIKQDNIDSKIEESLFYGYKDFWYLNNGIIIVCNDFNFVGDELRMKEFSIVNGGQTSRMIGTTPFKNDFFITCKVIKNTFETINDKNDFISKVAEASNTQKPIKAKDIIANKLEQRNLKSLMLDNNVFIEIKRGEKCNREIYKEPWQRTKNNELAQDLYSFVYLEPGPARNSISKLLENRDKYAIIFTNHQYTFEFLKDLIVLEKAYKEYQKKISKEPDIPENAVKKGLVKNGMTYALAVIGYTLKIIYNSEYYNDMYKYRNNDSMCSLYAPELAFMHSFIKETNYNDFVKNSFGLFDYIFSQLIIPQFNVSKELSPSTAYSNWTKSNTGFLMIRKMLNAITMDNKQTYIVDGIKKYFKDISQDEENKNIDRYYDYCKKNKSINIAKAKDSAGNVLNESDAAIRDALMIFRLNTADKNHVKENKIFSDKALDKLVIEKPVTMEELRKIVPPQTAYQQGEQILKIISKYL